MKKKLILSVVCFTPILIILIFVLIFFYPAYPFLTPSTNLSEESIGPLKLNDQLDKEWLSSLGTYELREQPKGYGYSSKDFYIRTNNSNQILSISLGSNFATSSGVNIGDTVDHVIKTYGKHYYTYREMGLGDAVEYIDRDSKRKLTFWTMDDIVVNIWLSSIED